jgi:hypothetical protein
MGVIGHRFPQSARATPHTLEIIGAITIRVGRQPIIRVVLEPELNYGHLLGI